MSGTPAKCLEGLEFLHSRLGELQRTRSWFSRPSTSRVTESIIALLLLPPMQVPLQCPSRPLNPRPQTLAAIEPLEEART